MSFVEPFQFEPEYDESEIPDDVSEEEVDSPEENIIRIGTTDWCLCEECKSMATHHESYCCQELDALN